MTTRARMGTGAPTDRELTEMLAALAATECSVPICDRIAVSIVRQPDGTVFPVCSRHAEKAMALGFPVIRPTDDPSALEEHDLTRPVVQAGDPAPTVRLPLLEHGVDGRPRAGELVDVSGEAHGKPVALVFGAYSVPKFRKQVKLVEELSLRYSGRVRFFLVYSHEVWFPESSGRPNLIPAEPASVAERAALAARLVHEYDLSIPVLIDGIDDDVARSFGGFPMRLYLIGANGRIAYQGGVGPYAFRPSELEAAIRNELA